jgi:hypothetical protein
MNSAPAAMIPQARSPTTLRLYKCEFCARKTKLIIIPKKAAPGVGTSEPQECLPSIIPELIEGSRTLWPHESTAALTNVGSAFANAPQLLAAHRPRSDAPPPARLPGRSLGVDH